METLPDITNTYDFGDGNGAQAGPGYAGVTMTSIQPVVQSRTNTGVMYRSINEYHKWDISIKYNKLTEQAFQTVYNFLLGRQGDLAAFNINLPQYGNSGAATKTITAAAVAGLKSLTLNNTTNIKAGDMFNVVDATDITHTKAYKVTKVSGNTIFLSPGLQKAVPSSAQVAFTSPKVQVTLSGDSLEYSLDADGLYSFSLKVEESMV